MARLSPIAPDPVSSGCFGCPIRFPARYPEGFPLPLARPHLLGFAASVVAFPDGVFYCVINPGVFGGLFGMGIINQPNVGILAVGSFQKRPVVKETEYGDTIVIRHMVYLTLSYDHRIIDGSCGTKFLSRLVVNIEQYNYNKIQN